jgi:hypothetical protein
MIMKEAVLGGTYWPDYLESERELPEDQRVTFVYKALTNREKIELLDEARGPVPHTVSLLKKCVTGIRNIGDGKGGDLDTIDKLLDYPDSDHTISYMLCIAAQEIWRRQGGTADLLKNSGAPSTAGAKAISTKEQPDS